MHQPRGGGADYDSVELGNFLHPGGSGGRLPDNGQRVAVAAAWGDEPF